MNKTKYYSYLGGVREIEIPEPDTIIPEDYTIVTIGREVQQIRIELDALVEYIGELIRRDD